MMLSNPVMSLAGVHSIGDADAKGGSKQLTNYAEQSTGDGSTCDCTQDYEAKQATSIPTRGSLQERS